MYNFPVADYVTDTISVLDQSIRILQCMIDISVMKSYAKLSKSLVQLLQSIKQGLWPMDPNLLILPHLSRKDVENIQFEGKVVTNLLQFKNIPIKDIEKVFSKVNLPSSKITDIIKVIRKLNFIEFDYEILGAKQKLGRWFLVKDKEYTLQLKMKRIGNTEITTIYCPRFPKAQTQGWFVILSDDHRDSLIALKRVSSSNSQTLHVNMYITPESLGDVDFDIHVMNDGYLGLDMYSKLPLTIYENN
jgi:hypothetical protein